MKILILGDIVGRPGRNFLKQKLEDFKKAHKIDRIIANGENAAGGAGITAKTANEILGSGVDAITLGDHYKIGLFTVLGRTFMGPKVNCPFQTASRLVEEMKSDTDAIIVEIHAETTSEKEAMGWHLDGKVSLVFGTHTHVPTADGRILKGGTAYQSDLGMTGPRESVLGREIEACLGRFIDGMPRKCPVAEGDVGMQGCLIELKSGTQFPLSFERIEFRESD